MVGCWHGYLSGPRCRLAYGPADATATLFCFSTIQTAVVLEKYCVFFSVDGTIADVVLADRCDTATGLELLSILLSLCFVTVCTFYLPRAGARFTKYLTTILRLSYDNAKVMVNLRRTSNLQNVL